MQIICTSLQTDNHAITLQLRLYRPDALPATQKSLLNLVWLLQPSPSLVSWVCYGVMSEHGDVRGMTEDCVLVMSGCRCFHHHSVNSRLRSWIYLTLMNILRRKKRDLHNWPTSVSCCCWLLQCYAVLDACLVCIIPLWMLYMVWSCYFIQIISYFLFL